MTNYVCLDYLFYEAKKENTFISQFHLKDNFGEIRLKMRKDIFVLRKQCFAPWPFRSEFNIFKDIDNSCFIMRKYFCKGH